MVFNGTYDHTIDSKNRLAIPAEIRTRIRRSTDPGDDEPISLCVTLAKDDTLCLYTEKGYNKQADALDNSEMDPEELLEYERIFYSLSRSVEFDKQGRITLPAHLLQRARLGTEVVLIGVKDHLEVRDRKTWYDYLERKLKDQPDILMNPRLAMKRR